MSVSISGVLTTLGSSFNGSAVRALRGPGGSTPMVPSAILDSPRLERQIASRLFSLRSQTKKALRLKRFPDLIGLTKPIKFAMISLKKAAVKKRNFYTKPICYWSFHNHLLLTLPEQVSIMGPNMYVDHQMTSLAVRTSMLQQDTSSLL